MLSDCKVVRIRCCCCIIVAFVLMPMMFDSSIDKGDQLALCSLTSSLDAWLWLGLTAVTL